MSKYDSSYGTLSEPLVVEPEVARSVAALKGEMKSTKLMVVFGLFLSCVFCIATFAMVCVATEYSKEVTVINSALTDKRTQQVLSTREHEELITDPVTFANGIRWLTFKSSDGGMTRAEVNGFEKVQCESGDYCLDGFHYVFHTAFGDYVADETADGYTFKAVEDSFVHMAKAASPAQAQGTYATGYDAPAKN